MNEILNPYTPNAGALPPIFSGRDDQLHNFDVLLQRLSAGKTEKSLMITGLRGVGKTVLLNEFARIAGEMKWVVLESEISKYDNAEFKRILSFQIRKALLQISPKQRWSDRVQNAANVLKSFTMSFDPNGTITAGLSNNDQIINYANTGDLSIDLTEMFLSLGYAAKENNVGVLFLFDEIQFLKLDQLESLIKALHKTVQNALPITMVGAGLPQLPALTGETKSYAERLYKFIEISTLSFEDTKKALQIPAQEYNISFTDESIKRIYIETDGYPYFIQEFGSAAWLVADESPIDSKDIEIAKNIYLSTLDDSFFRVRVERSTELEIAYMRAMAELSGTQHLASEVASILGRTSEQSAPIRAGLIEKGLLYTPQHGYASFSVPHFDKFIKRFSPELIRPPLRKKQPNKK